MKLIRIIHMIFAIGVFLSAALLVKELLVGKYAPLPGNKAQKAMDAPMPDEKNFSQYESISNSVFGKGTVALMNAGADALPRESSGDIQLIGTIVGTTGNSYAIFFDRQSKKQDILKLNEDVFGIGALKEVAKDHVLISSAANTLTLYLPEHEPGPSSGSAQPVIRQANAQRPQLAGLSKKTSESEWIIDQRALNSVLSDMDKILTDARLLPYSDNGKVAGFRISEIKPGGVFSLIGLQNGDVLLRVNDFEIDSPEKGIQLLNGLKGETSLSLDIVRNNSPRKLKYQIR